MIEIKSYTKIKTSSERNFGIVFSIFFLIIFLYPLFKNQDIKLWALLISIIILFLSFFFPQSLILPNKLWTKIGFILGAIIAPIIMALMFFFIVTPTGIIMRLFKKDLINQKIDQSKKTYWIKKKDMVSSMKNQY